MEKVHSLLNRIAIPLAICISALATSCAVLLLIHFPIESGTILTVILLTMVAVSLYLLLADIVSGTKSKFKRGQA